MRFDFTKAKKAVYMVSVYMPDGCTDHLYYHYYKEAKKKFNYLISSGFYEKGTAFSIYNMERDIRKDYKKL